MSILFLLDMPPRRTNRAKSPNRRYRHLRPTAGKSLLVNHELAMNQLVRIMESERSPWRSWKLCWDPRPSMARRGDKLLAARYRHLKRYQLKPARAETPKGRRNRVSHRVALYNLVELIDSKRAQPAVEARAAKIFVEIMMRAAGLRDG